MTSEPATGVGYAIGFRYTPGVWRTRVTMDHTSELAGPGIPETLRYYEGRVLLEQPPRSPVGTATARRPGLSACRMSSARSSSNPKR